MMMLQGDRRKWRLFLQISALISSYFAYQLWRKYELSLNYAIGSRVTSTRHTIGHNQTRAKRQPEKSVPRTRNSLMTNQALLSPEEHAAFLNAAEKIKQTALRQLQNNPTRPHIIHFIANLQRGVDSVTQAALDQGSQFDCKAGCNHCCQVRVEALEPEIFLIARELRQWPDQKLGEVMVRLQNHAAAVKVMPAGQHRSACPFLDQNLCSIYAVRPAVCRKAHSFDVTKCATPGADIPQNLDLVVKAEALMKGTAEAYRSIELPASAHELGQAVLLAMTDDAAESRWADGAAIFDTNVDTISNVPVPDKSV
jgi:Fe-S-cluster containining protein